MTDEPEMTPVDSSTIKARHYDADQMTLRLAFHSGDKVYTFYGVPPDVHDEMMAAPSIGSFFHKHIRGKYGAPVEPAGDA